MVKKVIIYAPPGIMCGLLIIRPFRYLMLLFCLFVNLYCTKLKLVHLLTQTYYSYYSSLGFQCLNVLTAVYTANAGQVNTFQWSESEDGKLCCQQKMHCNHFKIPFFIVKQRRLLPTCVNILNNFNFRFYKNVLNF